MRIDAHSIVALGIAAAVDPAVIDDRATVAARVLLDA
jgi:hypothetical protein